MKLTINEIAEMAQVAKSTVSKALNGQKGVSEENRKRILTIVQQVNFQPNSTARALAQSKTDTIGFVLPHAAPYSLTSAYWTGIITALAEEVSKHGSNLMVITPSCNDENDFSALNKIIRQHTIDGLIIGAEQLDTKSMMSIIVEEIPFVFIGRNQVIQHYSVDVNNREGADQVVSHLINQGFKNIMCFTGPVDYLYINERINGFKDAMARFSLNPNRIISSPYTEYEARKNAERILLEYPDTDAIFFAAGGDFFMNSVEVFHLSGINLKKIGLGVFDDSRFFDFLDWSITAAKQPMEKIGSTAAKMLFELIDGKVPVEKNCCLPVEIILR